MLKPIDIPHSRLGWYGLALAGAGCGCVVAFAFIPSILGLLAAAAAIAAGASLMILCCLRSRKHLIAAAEENAKRMAELDRRVSVQSREMAAQAMELAQQRDGYRRAAREIAEKQRWLETVLTQLPTGILLVDNELNAVSQNERFRTMLGMPPEAAPTKNLLDLHGWPAETLDGTPVGFQDWPLVRAIRDGVNVHDQEMRVGVDGGGWFEAAVSAAPIRDATGLIRGGVLLINDLSARRENEERLRLLESAVVHANDAIIVLEAVSAEGKGRSVKYVNDAFTRLTGYKREEVLGRSLHFLRGSDTDKATLDSLRVALDTATPFRTELLNYRKDGSVVWVDLSLVPVQGPDGHCTHYIMIQRDVTARKIAEGSLRESEELFRGIFETTSAGVSISDETGKFVQCNPAFAKMLGRTVRQVIGLSPEQITHPDDWEAQRHLIDAVRTGRSDRYQFAKRYVRRDGSIVWAELTFSSILDSDGNYQYGLGVSVDVTARRQLEDQLRQSQKMEALGQLAGGIAHDFNNLLTAVLGNLALVKVAEDDPNREMLRVVEQAAGRAADLTRKLLGYARRNQLLVAATQPGKLIAEVVDILRHTLDPRIQIVVNDQTTSSVTVDASLINQALFNLCLNARDAMPGGGTLTLEAEEHYVGPDALPNAEAQPGIYVRLGVKDTGFGMNESIRERLFEPFFTTKGVGKGTGLGLPMVHGIMEQHDGWVAVETAPGEGSRFSLFLPATAEESPKRLPVNTRLPAENSLAASIMVETPPPMMNATILLVDDESMIRRLGRAVLETNGFTVLEAEDGQEAVEVFEREHGSITLVVLDVTMPRLSGRDAYHQMKQVDPDVRVLFSSGYSSEDVAEIDASAGLLSKPYRPNDLLAAVRKALRKPRETLGV